MKRSVRFTRPEPPREYVCRVCGERAWFGYGVRLLSGSAGVWYCVRCRPADEARP